jgi:mRNA-degrading endonuclease RelE of RelBE toxin-antitoxin system
MKKLKNQAVYNSIFTLAFTLLPAANSLREIADVKPMTGYPNRYRIRIGSYRVGIELQGNTIEMMRVLHRREFYRYFP